MPRLTAIVIGNEALTQQCAALWIERGHGIAAVVTRNRFLAEWAEAQGLPVHAPGPDLAERLAGASCDWLLSIANLSLVPDAVLALARRGAVNFHDGPLPRHAGLNAPVWALLEGEAEHGIAWHLIAGGVDEGDLLVDRRFPIARGETALTLNAKCFEAALETFPEVMTQLENGCPKRRAQDLSRRTLHLRDDRPAAFALLDPARPSAEIVRMVRALDHGDYRNPMVLPRIRAGAEVLLVRRAEITSRDAPGQPGLLQAVEPGAITLLAGDGAAVRLSGLTSSDGGPVDATRLASPGDVLRGPGAEEAATLDALQRRLAPHDGFWRRRLTDMRPLALPLPVSTGAAEVRSRPLDLGGAEEERALTLAALWALRAAGEAEADIAWRGAGQPDPALAQHASPWVPLRVTEADGTLDALAEALTAEVAMLEDRAGFATDLTAREPGLTAPCPAIGLRRDGIAALIPGTALTVSLDAAGAQLHHESTRVTEAHAELLARRLEAMAAHPATTPAELPVMPDAERALVLQDWNRTGKPYDTACLHEMVEAQVSRTPDAPALVFEAEVLSYAQLNARANRVAHVLAGMGVRPGTLVGLSMPRSADMLVAALGILKAGGAYVPMDPAYPADRIALFIDDSGAPVIVTDGTTALPDHRAQVLRMDDPRLADAPEDNPQAGAAPSDIAYMIYTSGSTGRPKGVMVEHRNLANFCAGMDDRIDHARGGVWLAVTSLNFDISVLELFYTLARGFKLVLTSDEGRVQTSSGRRSGAARGMEFSLYYWGNDDGTGPDKYRTLLEGAKFADRHGFVAVWTPERHFHAFGGPYPNPSVTGAAVAAVTDNIGVRAGSCVAPLHHTARIAEEWAVIDNLTNGRAGLAIASGWQPDDFVLRPENTPPANKPAMFDQIRDLRRLWSGEAVGFPRADGTLHEVVTQPRPVSKELPVWVTTAGNPETWRQAGEVGANVLTHLLGQNVAEVGEKIALYHEALRTAGRDPADHTVTLMLHTFVAETREAAREIAREPMKDYLRSAAGLIKQYAWAFPAFKKPKGVETPFELDLGSLTPDELEGILDFAFQRYFDESGLFGTVEDCVARVEELKAIGVDEVACLIDYGIPADTVLEGLRPLARVLAETNRVETLPEGDYSIAAQIRRHGVTHLQCTPSMARMIAADEAARAAMSGLREVLLGGEPLPGALAAEIRQITGARLLNMYGPTETTIWSSVEEVEPGEGVVNIGTPIANTQLYVLDEAQQPVPVGVAGELWIGGDGVTRGYWQREDLTAERFLPDPFREGGRMYRTGDLVRRRADGRIDFVGRADHQVKLRGYRIELGEVEATLEAMAEVTQAVALVREDRPGDLRLVAYLRGDERPEAEIRARLAERLPAHMVPAHVVWLESFPLTPNRKVDRKALPAPQPARQVVAPTPPPPDTEQARPSAAEGTGPAMRDTPSQAGPSLEDRIGAIWARILGLPSVGPRDNFFDLGGHSLLAVQAHREMRDSLGLVDLGITDIFRFPVLSAFAARAGGAVESTAPRAAPRAASQPAPAEPAPPPPP
ncbi:LLM class flavin-dependent oxidoreductase, partial [Aquicoccus sp. SCR17]|nr:LLM class flavin-dependent oxidoreductase [Carideicomes alvinocaridis]